MTDSILPAIARMQPGDHYCGIYRTDEDHRAIIVDFVREGVARNEKMFYLVNLQTAEQLRTTLTTAGIDVDTLAEKGQLVIMTAKEAYLRDGQFDPDAMIKLLAEETDKALAEGYTALRATGEMTWALAGEPGSERLVEYEARVNELFAHKKCYGLCQYDRRRFDSEMLLDIRIPAAPANDRAEQAGDRREKRRGPAGKRILIVDDNEDAADLLALMLERMGNTTRVANDPHTALALIEEFAPDLAVLDIGLPIMDGYELARRLRELPRTRLTRLIALSGYGQAADKQRAAAAGFDTHLVKPVVLEALQAAIEKLVS